MNRCIGFERFPAARHIEFLLGVHQMKKTALLTALILSVLATVSYATQIGDYYIGGSYNTIYSIVNGSQTTEGGGSVSVSKLNGVAVPYDYCVDLFTVVYVPADYKNSIITNNGTIHGTQQLNNYQEVAWLLDNYANTAITNKNMQIALQASIWTEVNGKSVYSLDTNYYAGTTVDTYYSQMLSGLAGNPVGHVSNYDWITPVDGNGVQYQAQVTAAPVPEPSTCLLFGAGIVGAVFLRRRTQL